MLKGVCLVTGAAGGLGRATAERLAKEGLKLVLLDKQGARLQTLADELPEAVAIPGCITLEEDVRRSLDAARDKFGRLDAVVNCAGLSEAHMTYNFHKDLPHKLEDFVRIINVNTVGTFNVIRLAAGLIAANVPDESGQRGVVVNTGSVTGYDGDIGHAATAAAAAGLAGMTLPLARDLAAGGIRVVTIAPGLFETPLLSYLPDKMVQFLCRMTPFPRRLGRPSEFAHLVHHVLLNRMINGEVIRLDGALRLFPL